MSVNSKMTAIADEVRELSGATEAMGLDTMASTLYTENTNFASNLTTQDDLIAQIQAAVDGLPEAGGGSSEPALQNKTVIPNTISQIVTADSGYDGLDTVTVNAIPDTYVEPLITKEATTYIPTITDQYIYPSTYCVETQTIKGDANLIPANIVSGKSIFGVAGTAEVGGSSGGSVETCTVCFDNRSVSDDTPIRGIAAMVIENGVMKPYLFDEHTEGYNTVWTVPNVVCGSVIRLNIEPYGGAPYVEIEGSAIFESYEKVNLGFSDYRLRLTFIAPTNSNENCTIYYAYNF